MFHRLFAHPLTRHLDIDDPQTTELRKEIIQGKGFLRRIYDIWYRMIYAEFVTLKNPILEIGSGAGFLYEYLPDLITSDIFFYSSISAVMDGIALPFEEKSLAGITMTNVLHHIPNIREFFNEADRCLTDWGKIVLIEPWVTPWSRFIYTKLHHEPFNPEAREWSFPPRGPLSGANGALPWIIFVRDRNLFYEEYPRLRIIKLELIMPFSYLISGGISYRSLMPEFSFNWWQRFEHILHPWYKHLAMFVLVVIQKQD